MAIEVQPSLSPPTWCVDGAAAAIELLRSKAFNARLRLGRVSGGPVRQAFQCTARAGRSNGSTVAAQTTTSPEYNDRKVIVAVSQLAHRGHAGHDPSDRRGCRCRGFPAGHRMPVANRGRPARRPVSGVTATASWARPISGHQWSIGASRCARVSMEELAEAMKQGS